VLIGSSSLMINQEKLSKCLHGVDEDFVEAIMRIPPRGEVEPSPFWLHFEMAERYKILQRAGIEWGMNILEVGCGANAITTVALAYLVGESGRVVAVDIGRLEHVEEVLNLTGMKQRVFSLALDAAKLPFEFECFDLAVVVHGIRSFRNEETIVRILREMLRVSPRLFIAESLPLAKTKAQAAHLEMYNLREDIFEAVSGVKDDIHYLPLHKLRELVERAGGRVTEALTLDIGQPHFLAYIPKEIIEKIEDRTVKQDFLRRWEVANSKIQKYGEEHLPVGIVKATR
jgi:ubiquinone/menaquinone biosynthesis C-methylase UbiE